MPDEFHLVLASTSPRRREFMTILGVPFTAVSPDQAVEVDETPFPHELPEQLVQRLSRRKAQVVAENLSSFPPLIEHAHTHQLIIIAADTVVALDNRILGKPQTPDEAAEMLSSLRQQAHDVYSGLTVIHPAHKKIVTLQHHSQVWMRPYTDAEIETYVATGSPLDKAGAYGIQDEGFAPVARFDGCFASVMGLPLAELADELRRFGVPLPPTPTFCSPHIGIPCCQS
ncbi:MAG: septum formation protein Maf [Anaerolineae bacterium]|nr:septum formation protein Maf [Anaerolineae bacterium]